MNTVVVGRTVERRYAGYVNWNGLVPVRPELAPHNSWVIYVGNGQRASLMPVGGGFYFFLDVPLPKDAPPQGNIRQELAHHFAGWATPVQTLIETLDPERTNRIPIHDVEPLATFVRGRVALRCPGPGGLSGPRRCLEPDHRADGQQPGGGRCPQAL